MTLDGPVLRERRGGFLSSFGGVRYLAGLLPLACGLVLWELVGDPGSAYFPPPSSWWDALQPLRKSGQLGPATVATMQGVGISLVVATILGAAIGFLLGRYRHLDRAMNSTFEFLRAVPPAAVVPVFVLLIGYTLQMKIAVIVFAAIWPVLLSTRSATLQISSYHIDVAKTLQLGEIATLRKLIIPQLIPGVFIGVRVAAPLTLIITLLVEILTQVTGIGALLSVAQHNFSPQQAYGLVTLVGVMALAINILVNGLESVIVRRFPTHAGGS